MNQNDEVVGHYNPDTGKIEYHSIGRDFVPHEFETEEERREYWANQLRKRKNPGIVDYSGSHKK